MAENLYRALWSWLICVGVTGIVSYFTMQKPSEELTVLVYGYTEIPKDDDVPLYKRPAFWAVGVAIMFAVLQYIFWQCLSGLPTIISICGEAFFSP